MLIVFDGLSGRKYISFPLTASPLNCDSHNKGKHEIAFLLCQFSVLFLQSKLFIIIINVNNVHHVVLKYSGAKQNGRCSRPNSSDGNFNIHDCISHCSHLCHSYLLLLPQVKQFDLYQNILKSTFVGFTTNVVVSSML